VKPWHEVRPQAKTRPNTEDALSKAGYWAGTRENGTDEGSSRQEMS
jgi:hypothetical protein